MTYLAIFFALILAASFPHGYGFPPEGDDDQNQPRVLFGQATNRYYQHTAMANDAGLYNGAVSHHGNVLAPVMVALLAMLLASLIFGGKAIAFIALLAVGFAYSGGHTAPRSRTLLMPGQPIHDPYSNNPYGSDQWGSHQRQWHEGGRGGNGHHEFRRSGPYERQWHMGGHGDRRRHGFQQSGLYEHRWNEDGGQGERHRRGVNQPGSYQQRSNQERQCNHDVPHQSGSRLNEDVGQRQCNHDVFHQSGSRCDDDAGQGQCNHDVSHQPGSRWKEDAGQGRCQHHHGSREPESQERRPWQYGESSTCRDSSSSESDSDSLPIDKEERLMQQALEASIQEQARQVSIQEQARQASLKEQARQASLKEQARQASLKEQARQASLKEQARQASLKEQARQASLKEQARQAAVQERARRASVQEEKEKNRIPESASEAYLNDPIFQTVLASVAKTVEKGSTSNDETRDADPRRGKGDKRNWTVIIPRNLQEEFLKYRRYDDSKKEVEISGWLLGIKDEKHCELLITEIYMTPQSGSSDRTESTSDIGYFQYIEKSGLQQLGWIHTHPTYDCYLSSIDLHTQYGVQVTEECAIAMVYSGVQKELAAFKLNENGMNMLKACDKPSGEFHEHPDVGSLYDRVEYEVVNR